MSEKPPRRGQIWWVRFPDKRRMGVIMSPDVRLQEGENVILAGMTSKRVDEVYPHEVRLEGLDLPKRSKVQCDYLVTVKQSILDEYVTTVLEQQMKEIEQAATQALGTE